MAERIGYAILGKIGEHLVDPIARQFRYLFCFNNNIQDLGTQLKELKPTREAVQLGVDQTRNNVRTVGPQVEKWLTKANDNTVEAEAVIESKAQVSKGCLNGWCPNLRLRYSLSRKAVKKTQDLVRLKGEGNNYTQLSYNPPPACIEPIPTTEFKGFDSRILVMNEIIEALKDDGINLIGICGMGGIGKTTMAKEVAKSAREDNLFDEVPMAVVSQEPNLTKVQGCIANMLGLKLDDNESPIARASLLRKRLLQDNKKILVILDDIWAEFELEDLGFPLRGDGNKGCKILFTSRNRNMWRGIQNKRDIQLEVLVEEEPWHLFREKAGNCVDAPDLLPLAKMIVNECGGLPLALVTLASALTNERNQHHWNDALRQLRTPCSESILSGVPAKVYQALDFSYRFLKDEGAKKLFLLCCLFSEDYNIPIEELVRYGIGLQWFEGIDKVDEVRDLVNVLVDQLKSSYLLLDGDDEGEEEEQIKMHDIVRDVAISIASRDKHGFMIIDAKSREWPKKASYELNTSISMMSDEVEEFPEGLKCPKLEFLLIESWNGSLKIPSNFFQGMGEMKVLKLRIREIIPLLPSSLRILSNLLTLCLDGCHKFDNISVIGELLNLEILSFCNSDMDELPKEIERLANLRLLDLKNCFNLKRIPPGVISALGQLQELYMSGCDIIWEEEGKEEGENASLREFESLSNLNTLEIDIKNVMSLPRIQLFSKLTKYEISIGCDSSYENFREAFLDKFGSILSKEDNKRFRNFSRLILADRCTISSECGGINLLLRSTAGLLLSGKGSEDVVQELFREGIEGLQLLKVLVIIKCHTPECLANTMEWVPRITPPIFPMLECLDLIHLHNLRNICHGQLSAGSFRKLKGLQIWNCEKMEEVIWKERREEDATNKMEFPELKILCLGNLPMLIGFCRGIDEIEIEIEIEFPQLKELYLKELPQFKCLFLNSSNPFSDSMENQNATFLSLFPNKVAFPRLVKLELHGLQNMSEIWCNQLQTGSFSGLIELCSFDCNNLRNLFSPFMARYLAHLENIVISCCSKMEEVVAKEENEEGEGRINRTPILPKLKYLKLINLPMLQSFCHVTHDWELPLLEHITISNCHEMKNFSPGVICTPKLQQRVFVNQGYYKWFLNREREREEWLYRERESEEWLYRERESEEWLYREREREEWLYREREREEWLWMGDLNQTVLHLFEKDADDVDSTAIQESAEPDRAR